MAKPPGDKSSAAAAFSVIDRRDWVARLVRSDKGVLAPVLDNVVAILRNDDRWAGVIALDEMSGQIMKMKPPPYDRGETGEWFDIDDARLEHWLAINYAMRSVQERTLLKAVALTADSNRFHEVRNYLDPLQWDGKPRARQMLWAYCGAQRTDYVEAVAAKWLVSAIARVYLVTSKVDHVLILEGPQYAGKSTVIKTLFHPWFTDAAFELGSADGYQIIRGMWGVELAELDDFNRAESSRAKAFFTREKDRYRPPYGRKIIWVPRQCVFAGTVNPSTYLRDSTGNRRYWPVTVGYIGLDKLEQDRDQIWAEARQLYRDGVEWWVRAAERDMFTVEQDARYIGDAWETRVRDWLDTPDAAGFAPKIVTTARLMQYAIGLDTGKWSQAEQQRVGRIMARIAWPRARERRPRAGSTSREWVYVRPDYFDDWKEEQCGA